MDEAREFLAALAERPEDARTACVEWQVRDLVAHLAAGAQEEADLVEAALRGDPPRPTRDFAEREAAFRAKAYPRLLKALAHHSRRLVAAIDALIRDGGAVEFTGALLTGQELRMHSRSELAVHRWDLVGSDDISNRLLAQPELTAHAVTILTRMPSLQESVAARAARVTDAPDGFGFGLRSPGTDDVLVRLGATPSLSLQARADGEDDRDGLPVVRCSPADRLLLLWGRRPPRERVDLSGLSTPTTAGRGLPHRVTAAHPLGFRDPRTSSRGTPSSHPAQ